jgi:hypothetical protein
MCGRPVRHALAGAGGDLPVRLGGTRLKLTLLNLTLLNLTRLNLGEPPSEQFDLGVPLGNGPGDEHEGTLGRAGVIAEHSAGRPVLGDVGPGQEVSAGRELRPFPRQLAAPAHSDDDHAGEDDDGREDDSYGHTAIVPRLTAWCGTVAQPG